MTPQQEYYSINVRLKPEDKKDLDTLRKRGKTIVSVVRSGIKTEMRRK